MDSQAILELLNNAETQRLELIARRGEKLTADQAVIAAQNEAANAAGRLADSETVLANTRVQLHEAIDALYGSPPAPPMPSLARAA